MSSPVRTYSWPTTLAVFVAIGVAFATSQYAAYSVKGSPEPLGMVLYWSLSEWVLWVPLVPFILGMDRRFPLSRTTWKASLPWHLLAYVAVLLLHESVYVTLERFFGMSSAPPEFGRYLLLYYSKKGAFDLLVYAGVVGFSSYSRIYGRYRERELRASQLESQLTRAQLDVLRTQLQPHFLFNTLNTISSLVRSDAEGAERVVSRLGDLLRLSLAQTEEHELPLGEELEVLGHYLDIQRSRFRERLITIIDCPADTLDVLVPVFVLQPVVENAVRHGVEPRGDPGTVEIRSRRSGDRLLLTVSDNGPGLAEGVAALGNGRGIGLSNTRARLAQLYGSEQSFTVANRAAGGVEVRIEIPWRRREVAGV